MLSDRFVVLGLGSVRSVWPRDVTTWAMSGAVAVEFIQCVSIDEMKARLRSGRAFSAILCDAEVPGADRDLFAQANEVGAAVIIVGETGRNWLDLGAKGQLHGVFAREELLTALTAHAEPVHRRDQLEVTEDLDQDFPPFEAQMVAVTGRIGSGCSTSAIALAQGFGSSGRMGGLVALADLAIDGDQAMLHDATDIVPGLQELVEAHRSSRQSNTQIRSMTYAVPHRRYDLLLGLRRSRDWVSLRPRAFEATLAGLRRSYRMVVADISGDFEGEAQCGSIDVEERNLASRCTALAADVVVAVGDASLVGVHGLVRTIDALLELGVSIDQIVPVINRSPRSQRSRSELAGTIAQLVNTEDQDRLIAAHHLPERRHLDDVHRNGTPMPEVLCAPLLKAVEDRLATVRPDQQRQSIGLDPVEIGRGSIGSLSDDAA